MDFKSEIKERDELIQYLREQLINATGQDVEVPYRWEKFTGPPIAPKFAPPVETTPKTFTQAVKDLDLPLPAPEPKKNEPIVEVPSAKDHEKITLAGFNNRGVNKDALINFIGGVKRLTKIKIVDLSRNGLTDVLCPEIEEIVKFNKIVRLNLSNNDLGKGFLAKFGELLKTGGTHLEWLE
jgi:hypothetical protein